MLRANVKLKNFSPKERKRTHKKGDITCFENKIEAENINKQIMFDRYFFLFFVEPKFPWKSVEAKKSSG